MDDIYKKMGQRAFSTVAATPKRTTAAESTPSAAMKRPTSAPLPAPKKPAARQNGLFEGHQTPSGDDSGSESPGSPPHLSDFQPVKPPPPFFIEVSTGWIELATELKKLVDNDLACLARGRYYRVRTSTPDNFRKIQRYLLGKNVAFHTFTLGGGRNLKVVLSGLPGYAEEADVHNALEEKRFCVDGANRLRARHGRSNRWLITLARDVDREDGQRPAADIWDVQELLHVRVTWASYKGPGGPPQCYKCQGYGHGSSNCGRPTRCVRCGGPHNKTQCKTDYAERKCCNCGGPHQANYRGCKSYLNARSDERPRPDRPTTRPTPPTAEKPTTSGEDVPASQGQPKDDVPAKKRRRKRAPRNPANRGPRTAKQQPETAKRPAAEKTAPAPAPQTAAPTLATRQASPATPAEKTTSEQPTPAPAATSAEMRKVLTTLQELTEGFKVLTAAIRQLLEERK